MTCGSCGHMHHVCCHRKIATVDFQGAHNCKNAERRGVAGAYRLIPKPPRSWEAGGALDAHTSLRGFRPAQCCLPRPVQGVTHTTTARKDKWRDQQTTTLLDADTDATQSSTRARPQAEQQCLLKISLLPHPVYSITHISAAFARAFLDGCFPYGSLLSCFRLQFVRCFYGCISITTQISAT